MAQTKPREADKREMDERIPVGSFRDKMTVANKDPKLAYRWVLHTDETSSIWEFEQGGWRFVHPEEKGIKVPTPMLTESSDYGSVIRIPAGAGKGYLYLMCIEKSLYEGDVAAQQKLIDEQEEGIYRSFSPNETSQVTSLRQSDKGFYGKMTSKSTNK